MTNTKPRRLALAAAALALFAGLTTTAATAAPTPDACSYKWCVQSGTVINPRLR